MNYYTKIILALLVAINFSCNRKESKTKELTARTNAVTLEELDCSIKYISMGCGTKQEKDTLLFLLNKHLTDHPEDLISIGYLKIDFFTSQEMYDQSIETSKEMPNLNNDPYLWLVIANSYKNIYEDDSATIYFNKLNSFVENSILANSVDPFVYFLRVILSCELNESEQLFNKKLYDYYNCQNDTISFITNMKYLRSEMDFFKLDCEIKSNLHMLKEES